MAEKLAGVGTGKRPNRVNEAPKISKIEKISESKQVVAEKPKITPPEKPNSGPAKKEMTSEEQFAENRRKMAAMLAGVGGGRPKPKPKVEQRRQT